MSFLGDGFLGDGFSSQSAVTPLPDRLAFIKAGREVNLLVEVVVQPRLADRVDPVPAVQTWFGDGFIGDGFTGDNFLSDVSTAQQVLRFSTRPTNFPASDPSAPNVKSRAIIREGIRFKRTFDEQIEGASSSIQIGNVELNDIDYYVSEIAATTRVDGRPVRFYIGPVGGMFDEYVLLASTYGEQWHTDQTVLRTRTATLILTDLLSTLDRQLQTAQFSGLGSTGGDPALAGRTKPTLIGRRKNVEGVLYDAANLLFMVNNGAAVFLSGRFGGEAAPYYGDFPSEAALIAARALMPEGSWATCAALGLYSPRPVGDGLVPFVFTVDCAGFNVTQVGDAIIAVLANFTPIQQQQIDYPGIAALNIGDGGYYASGDSAVTVKEVVEDLARGVFSRLVVGEQIGAVLLRDPNTSTFDRVIDKTSIGKFLRKKRRVSVAYRDFVVTYSPNDRVLTADEIVLPGEGDTALKAELQRPFETLIALPGDLTAVEHLTALGTYTHATNLEDTAIAADVQQRLKNYGQYERYIWEVELRADEIDLPLGGIVWMQIEEHPEWKNGKNALVVSVEPQFTQNTLVAELLV